MRIVQECSLLEGEVVAVSDHNSRRSGRGRHVIGDGAPFEIDDPRPGARLDEHGLARGKSRAKQVIGEGHLAQIGDKALNPKPAASARRTSKLVVRDYRVEDLLFWDLRRDRAPQVRSATSSTLRAARGPVVDDLRAVDRPDRIEDEYSTAGGEAPTRRRRIAQRLVLEDQ